MATNRAYGYQIKGDKLVLVEVDQTGSSDGLNYTWAGTEPSASLPFGTHGDAVDISSGSSALKSPINSVSQGIELEYTFSPIITFNNSSSLLLREVATSGISEVNFLWKTAVSDKNHLSYTFNANDHTDKFTVGGYVRITGNRFAGVHKVKSVSLAATNTYVIFETLWNDAEVSTESTAIYVGTMYYRMNILNDESDKIDISSYLSKALVYYVKAKVAEDQLNFDAKEYFMREFKRMLEKNESSKLSGPRMIMSGPASIR